MYVYNGIKWSEKAYESKYKFFLALLNLYIQYIIFSIFKQVYFIGFEYRKESFFIV